MISFNKLLFFFFILTIFSLSCSVVNSPTKTTKGEKKKTIASKVEGCKAVAKVKNFTHEAGCQYLLQMEDGTLFLPAILPETNVPFYEGAGLKIGYEILDLDKKKQISQSQCKSHDYLIKVTCLEEHVISEDGVPKKHDECITIKNPYKFNWMRTAINKKNPKRINEYQYNFGYIYEFKIKDNSLLYDCLGNYMCDTGDNSDCQSLLETLTKPKAILVVNN